MALFVRKSRSRGNWDNINNETPEDLAFPADVLADVLDSANELSVWEVNDPPGSELEIIAAALHYHSATDLSDMTFRVISDWKLKQLGLEIIRTPGDSVDSQLNKSGKHGIVRVNTIGDAISLAKAFKAREPHSFSRAVVMRRFAISVQEKRISVERITSGLWRKLIDDGHLQVIAQ